MIVRFALRSLVGLLVLWAHNLTPAFAQTASLRPDGRIDIRAQQAPAGRALRDLAAILPVTKLLIDPAAEGKAVTLPAASGLSPADALEAVLSASKLPYLVWGGTKGPWRVVLGDEASAVDVTTPSTVSAATEGDRSADASAPSGSAVDAYVAREAEMAEQAAAERKAEAEPRVVNDAPGVPGGYTQDAENVTYHDPNFVPYKNRPEVRARRQKIDVTTIP